MAQELNIHPLDFEPDTAIGIKISPSSVKGNMFVPTYTTLEQAKTNLLMLLLTNEGERVMHPTFGVGLPKLLFDPIDDALIVKMKDRIRAKAAIWLPYINVDYLNVEPNKDSNLIEIQIDFSLVGNTFDTETIVLELSLPPA